MQDPELPQEIAKTLRQRVLDAISRKAEGKSYFVALPEKYQYVPGVVLNALMFGTQEFVEYNRRMGMAKLLDSHGIAVACVMGIVDADGKPVFTDEDMAFLSSDEATGIRCYDMARIVLHVNNFIQDESLTKALAKNSEGTENSTSSAD